MSEERSSWPSGWLLGKAPSGLKINVTTAGMNLSLASRWLGSRCWERFVKVNVLLRAFCDWLSLNQNWGNHNDQPDETKISRAAGERSMQKHVNSFKCGKTRVTNFRLVRVSNNFFLERAWVVKSMVRTRTYLNSIILLSYLIVLFIYHRRLNRSEVKENNPVLFRQKRNLVEFTAAHVYFQSDRKIAIA